MTSFFEVERRLSLYLRALWGRDIKLDAFADSQGAHAHRRSTIAGDFISLPQSWADSADRSGLALYRAAVAHASAHLMFTTRRFPTDGLDPLQVATVSTIEDARVEARALRAFPGLRGLWGPFHATEPDGSVTAAALLARLARVLFEENYRDDHPWVAKARRLFLGQQDRWEDPSLSLTLGSLLGKDLRQLRAPFDFGTWVVEPAYRDDNLGIWDFGADDEVIRQGARHSGSEGGRARITPGPGVAAGEAGQSTVLTAAGPEAWSTELLSPPVRYDEWDYLIGRERPTWCTLQECAAAQGDHHHIDQVLERNRDLVNRVKQLVRALQVQRPIRLRKRIDGDRLDLDASIDATIDIRAGQRPDPRVHVTIGRRQRDLAVLVLLDLSQSTNDRVPGAGTTVLELAREATALLADAMDRIGDSFAIHGFSSNGRHEVRYCRFKDFDHPYGELAKSLLAGMSGQLSTRMGTALRHAGRCLNERRAHKKLVLLITDGEPSDIDVHDNRYLVLDAKKAVENNSRLGIHTYCLSLDPKADRYVSRIFGQRNWTVIDHLRRLPEVLPLLYMRLTH
ncbi:MAG TPA: VWA domain-containing protein [Burkholderiales bacterium]|nr:VWA domain-containing protein [Burkholderiales bacterium]